MGCTDDGQIKLYDMYKGHEVWTTRPVNTHFQGSLSECCLRVIRFSQCGSYLGTGGDNGTLLVYKSNIQAHFSLPVSYRTE